VAKREPVQAYVDDRLTEDEIELIKIAARGEQFLLYGWKKYREDWPNHLPRIERYECRSCGQMYSAEYDPAGVGLVPICPDCDVQVKHIDSILHVNLVSRWLFGWEFQRYQAELHYCPIRDQMVMGGRGCGKSETVGVSKALRSVLWPGHDWLHVGPTLDQAKLVYYFLLKQARVGKFWDLFVKDYHTNPLPEVFLHSWNEHDPGTRWLFRTIGENLERVRGERVGLVSVDEGFRLFVTDWYVGVLTGTARGVNEYILNSHPELKEEYARRVRDIEWEMNPFKRKMMQEKLERWVEGENLAKRTELTMIGNAPYHLAWWNRWEKGKADPTLRWSARWTSTMNLYLTSGQIAFWSQQFTDPNALAVELEAVKPAASGDVFPYLEDLFVGQLDELAVEAVENEEPGFVYETHPDWGLWHYEKPAEPGGVYAFGSDPGAGKIPDRNKWVIVGARIDLGPPFEIVYFRTGNIPGQHGSIDPWIAAAKDALSKYPMLEGDFAVESGGTQKHVHTVVWPDDLFVFPLNMGSDVATEVMKLQRMLRGSNRYGCMFHAPGIAMMELEMAEFKLKLPKDRPQDVVMAMLCLANRTYRWVASEFEKPAPVEDDDDIIKTFEFFRESRDSRREVRYR